MIFLILVPFFIVFGLLAFAPFILAGKLSEAEEREREIERMREWS